MKTTSSILRLEVKIVLDFDEATDLKGLLVEQASTRAMLRLRDHLIAVLPPTDVEVHE